MIDKNAFLEDIKDSIALWCGANMDPGDLARVAEYAIENAVDSVSVVPECVPVIWPWLEEKWVKIFARFYIANKKVTEKDISDITVKINAVLKNGAYGAQVFVPCEALPELVEQTHVIRDDLFFDRELAIGIDIGEIDVFQWDDVFKNLRKINASSVVFAFTKDTGNKSDFVGRIYGMLNAWKVENKFDLHFAFGPNFMRIEQAARLVQVMRPELVRGMRFWINF